MFVSFPALPVGVQLLCIVLLALWVPLAGAQPAAESELTLAGAIERALAGNPQLAQFPLRAESLRGQARTLAQRPALTMEAELENFGGGDDYRGSSGLETTLALSSAVELGGKRGARLALSDARLAMLESERHIATLDLLGDVTRRFIQLVYRQQRIALAQAAHRLAGETLASISLRRDSGAASQIDQLRAQAELQRAELALEAELSQLRIERAALAVLWNAEAPEAFRARGDLFAFGADDEFETLFTRVTESPFVRQFAGEARLKAAEERLARGNSVADIGWSLGARHFRQGGDMALVAGFSLPLFSGARAAGERQSAAAERELVTLKRQTALLSLRHQLYAAYWQRQQAVRNSRVLHTQVIPDLQQVLSQIQSGYAQGRFSYLDLTSAKRELLDARLDLLDSAAAAQRLGADIEQLTAQSLRAATSEE